MCDVCVKSTVLVTAHYGVAALAQRQTSSLDAGEIYCSRVKLKLEGVPS